MLPQPGERFNGEAAARGESGVMANHAFDA
jgi:hypothetical protein